MEFELIIAAVAIVLLLIIILIIFTARKRIPTKGQKPSAMQAEQNKPANKPILKPEPKKESLPESQANEPLRSAELKNEPIVEPQTNETVTLSEKDRPSSILPLRPLSKHIHLHPVRRVLHLQCICQSSVCLLASPSFFSS